jgi:LAO/AO transport system kinase
MQQHATDEGVFIRSLGTRGNHGGLSLATQEVVWALDAAKFDVILVETVGVGQTELEILKVAQTIVVVLVPESGDAIQVMKAGLMEIADVFAVNKCDRPESDQLVRELVNMATLSEKDSHDKHGWKNVICKTEAVRDKGMDELLTAIDSHQNHLKTSKLKDEKVRISVTDELTYIMTEKVGLEVSNYLKTKAGKTLIQNLVKKKTDPYAAAQKIFKIVSSS